MNRKSMVTVLKIVTAGFLPLCAGGAGLAQTEGKITFGAILSGELFIADMVK